MNGRIEKIKTHLSENKIAYLSCGATAVVTGMVVYVYKGNIDQVLVQNKITQILSWKPNATIEVYVEALGDPGNIIQDLTTGSVYASQGQVARELKVNPARISEHLNGARTNVQGHVLQRLAKASVRPLDEVA
jgi:hypothetical protein